MTNWVKIDINNRKTWPTKKDLDCTNAIFIAINSNEVYLHRFYRKSHGKDFAKELIENNITHWAKTNLTRLP